MPDFIVKYKDWTESDEGVGGTGEYKYETIYGAKDAGEAHEWFKKCFPHSFTYDVELHIPTHKYNPCEEILDVSDTNLVKQGDKFKMNGHEWTVEGHPGCGVQSTTEVRSPRGWTHYLFLEDQTLGIEKIEPEQVFEDGELYRDADGNVFMYVSYERDYKRWVAVVCATDDIMFGEYYKADYPVKPIVKVKIVEDK